MGILNGFSMSLGNHFGKLFLELFEALELLELFELFNIFLFFF